MTRSVPHSAHHHHRTEGFQDFFGAYSIPQDKFFDLMRSYVLGDRKVGANPVQNFRLPYRREGVNITFTLVLNGFLNIETLTIQKLYHNRQQVTLMTLIKRRDGSFTLQHELSMSEEHFIPIRELYLELLRSTL